MYDITDDWCRATNKSTHLNFVEGVEPPNVRWKGVEPPNVLKVSSYPLFFFYWDTVVNFEIRETPL